MVASTKAVIVLLLPLFASGQDLFLADKSYLAKQDTLFVDLFKYWRAYREPELGVYCDHMVFWDNLACGTDDRDMYSSAAAGMGLIAETIFVELGLATKEDAIAKCVQTLQTMMNFWPRETHHGFHGHFAKRKGKDLNNLAEYSTIDTALLAMGGIFAGNYFGGEVEQLALKLQDSVDWSAAIKSANQPTIYPVANEGGRMSGNIRPFNEYYIVAYIAMMNDPHPSSKARQYFDNYYGQHAWPKPTHGYHFKYWKDNHAGVDAPEPKIFGGFPFKKDFKGYDTLSDSGEKFMSSFIPQFCWFTCRGFNTDRYFNEVLFPSWLSADMKYWLDLVPEDTVINGQKVKGKVFGCGAGSGKENSYTVNRINGTEEPLYSVPIMAGFLPAADAPMRQEINGRIAWMMKNNVCIYKKGLPDGSSVRIPWRCSIKYPTWRAPKTDSIDYVTMLLGYAINYLPEGFYSTFAG